MPREESGIDSRNQGAPNMEKTQIRRDQGTEEGLVYSERSWNADPLRIG